ncbi:MAG: hypothetical protein ACR2PR_00285, partial [Pseudohongiellaceae bacterium]
GRIRGDLRWQGLRSLEVRDATDGFVRTLNDVATLVDTSGFAIVFASVAAMAADTTLEAGDIAETISYNLDQREGGARYEITTSAETVDNYRVIDLAPAGLQARLLDQELHRSPFAAGAVGDLAADDTTPVQTVLDANADVLIDGTFLTANLTVTASKRLSGGGTLRLEDFAGTDLLSLSGADVAILVDGIILDGNVANQATERTTALISSTVTASAATTLALIRCNNVRFINASQHDILARGNDAGFPIVYAISECSFTDGEQSTNSTPTACIRVEEGASAYIDDCYFSVDAAITTGRAAVTTGNSGTAVVNFGDLMVTGCTLNNMGDDSDNLRAALHITEIGQVLVNGNRILAPNYGGIAFGAECDQVQIQANLIDAGGGDNVQAHIESLTTAFANSGNDWLIDSNQMINSPAEGIAVDGSSAGNDASRVRVTNNQIFSPTLQAITYTNLVDVDIVSNFIDMDSVAGQNAIEAITNGISGQCQIAGNEILNVDTTTSTGGTTFEDTVSTGGSYHVDGNYFEGGAIGLNIIGGPDELFLTNNIFAEITDTLGTIDNMTTCWVDGNSYVGVNPTTFLNMPGSAGITNLKVGDNFWQQVDNTIGQQAVTGSNITVAAPNAKYMVLVPGSNTTIDTISSPGIDGYQVTYQKTSLAVTITFNDAVGNLNLGANRVLDASEATDTLTLVWNETNTVWNQVAYSNN